MSKEEIVTLALQLKAFHKTKDPFKIGENIGVTFDFTPFRKEAMQAYTIKPYTYTKPCICINSNFDKRSQVVLCAHELGHALMHNDACNHFNGDSLSHPCEYEANLFAVALLFDRDSFKIDITKMDNYNLKCILDNNITY